MQSRDEQKISKSHCLAAGRNTTQVDAKGNVKTMVFDAIGQLGTIQYADGSAVTFQYDAVNRRTLMQDSGGTTTYVYTDREFDGREHYRQPHDQCFRQ